MPRRGGDNRRWLFNDLRMIAYRIDVADAHAHLFRVSLSLARPATEQDFSLNEANEAAKPRQCSGMLLVSPSSSMLRK